MRMLLLAILLLVGASPVVAQSNGGRGENPPAACVAGDFFVRTGANPAPCVCGAANTWTCITSAGGGLDPGDILVKLSGTCAAGFEEATELNGKTLIGTLAANKDVGTTGGADTITDVINHTHPVDDPGHAHVEQNNSATTGGLAGWAARDTSTSTPVATGYSTQSATTGVTTTNPAGGVASIDNRSAFIKVLFCRKT